MSLQKLRKIGFYSSISIGFIVTLVLIFSLLWWVLAGAFSMLDSVGHKVISEIYEWSIVRQSKDWEPIIDNSILKDESLSSEEKAKVISMAIRKAQESLRGVKALKTTLKLLEDIDLTLEERQNMMKDMNAKLEKLQRISEESEKLANLREAEILSLKNMLRKTLKEDKKESFWPDVIFSLTFMLLGIIFSEIYRIVFKTIRNHFLHHSIE